MFHHKKWVILHITSIYKKKKTEKEKKNLLTNLFLFSFVFFTFPYFFSYFLRILLWWTTEKKINFFILSGTDKGQRYRFGWCRCILSRFQCNRFNSECWKCSPFDKIVGPNNTSKYNGNTTFTWNSQRTTNHFWNDAGKSNWIEIRQIYFWWNGLSWWNWCKFCRSF